MILFKREKKDNNETLTFRYEDNVKRYFLTENLSDY